VKSCIGGLFNSAPVAYSGERLRSTLLRQEKGGRESQMRAMGAVGTLFSIVNRTSNATAQGTWHLYRKSESGKKADRVEVTRHAALDLWNKPNPFMTQQEFVEASQQHVDLTGESEWLISRHAGIDIPLELWPIRPDKMQPVPHPTQFLKGWVYTGPEGEKVPLALNEVIQLRMPNPEDPYRGMGPVQSLLADLDSAKYSAEWNRNFFLNSAQPGGIIEVEKRLSDDEFDEMSRRWSEQHRGVRKAHRVAVLEQGKWVSTQFSMRDMQFTELRKVTRDTILEAFGMNKFMIGVVEDVNRANAEAGETVFARWMLIPRLERIKQALNNDLLPLFGTTGQGVEFDYDTPVPADRAADNNELTAKANAVTALVAAGFDAASVCAAVGMPEMTFVGGRPDVQPV
jgi:HK97 family phage portal protein